jgi:hypothetical protein
MGKKKTQEHMQQSMGTLVSKAALAQLAPEINEIVLAKVRELGGLLAQEQLSTLQDLFVRLVVLESLAVEKFGITPDELSDRVAQLQDESEGFKTSQEPAKAGDTIRLEIKTKTKDQAEFQGKSRLKVTNLGSGNSLGVLEKDIIGMITAETKLIEFGEDNQMIAEVSINKISSK